ncbi:MAG: hypothetical protein U5L96_01150 [Owenweeksia sp.]|nr:hypothetical protein [Owenweeksia sp.]
MNLYRREQGISLGATQTVNISSSCFSSIPNLTVTGYTEPGDSLYTDNRGVYIRSAENCVDQTAPGFAAAIILKYKYKACVVLPGICSDYTFSWSQCCRNANITNLATSPALYLESELNNTLEPNTSPFFLNPAAKFFCVNQPFAWSQAANEPDNDSLIYTLAQPWSAANTPINWAAGFSTTQPMITTNGFNLNPANGLMTFTPSQPDVDVIKMIVEEYRYDTVFNKWLLIGTAIREIQIPILNQCNPLATTGVRIKQGQNIGGVVSHLRIFEWR